MTKNMCAKEKAGHEKSLFAVFPSHDFGLKLKKWELDHI